MQEQECLDGHQSQSCALRLGCEKRFKKPFHSLWTHTDACVGDIQDDFAGGLSQSRRDAELAARRHGRARVGCEIEEDAVESFGIHIHGQIFRADPLVFCFP